MDFGLILLAIVVVGAAFIYGVSTVPADTENSEESYYASYDKAPEHPEDEARRRHL